MKSVGLADYFFPEICLNCLSPDFSFKLLQPDWHCGSVWLTLKLVQLNVWLAWKTFQTLTNKRKNRKEDVSSPHVKVYTLRIEPRSPIRASNCKLTHSDQIQLTPNCIHNWIFWNFKLPIQASTFEINWSAGNIRLPRKSGRVLTYTWSSPPSRFEQKKKTREKNTPFLRNTISAEKSTFWDYYWS